MDSLIILASIAILCFILFKLITSPIKGIFKFLIHAALGYVLLFIVNFFGSTYGIIININLITAAIAGFCGIPGVIFLVLLQLFI